MLHVTNKIVPNFDSLRVLLKVINILTDLYVRPPQY